jgi:hypothetical protein
MNHRTGKQEPLPEQATYFVERIEELGGEALAVNFNDPEEFKIYFRANLEAAYKIQQCCESVMTFRLAHDNDFGYCWEISFECIEKKLGEYFGYDALFTAQINAQTRWEVLINHPDKYAAGVCCSCILGGCTEDCDDDSDDE